MAGDDWTNLIHNLQSATADGLTPFIVITDGTGMSRTAPGIDEQDPVVPDPSYGTTSTMLLGRTWAGVEYGCGVNYLMYYLNYCSNHSCPGTPSGGYTPPTHFEAWNEPDTYDNTTQINGTPLGNSNGGGFQGPLGNTNKDGSASFWGNGPCGQSDGHITNSKFSTNLINDCGGSVVNGSVTHQSGASSFDLCGQVYTNGDCGPLEAAELWNLANEEAATVNANNPLFGLIRVAAFSGSHAYITGSGDYITSYINQVANTIGSIPTYWAVHDYDDPSWGSHRTLSDADYKAFLSKLATTTALGTGHNFHVYITESGVWLTDDQIGPDNNGYDTVCPAGPEPDWNTGSLARIGGCVDHDPSSQYAGEQTWYHLGTDTDLTHANKVYTDLDFWYEYRLQSSGTSDWDSAMVDSTNAGRGAYCGIAGLALSICTGNPDDQLDSTGQ